MNHAHDTVLDKLNLLYIYLKMKINDSVICRYSWCAE